MNIASPEARVADEITIDWEHEGLADFYFGVFRHGLGKCSAKYVCRFETAIRVFSHYRGRCHDERCLMGALDDNELLRFRLFVQRDGATLGTATSYWRLVRRVLRAALPAKFPALKTGERGFAKIRFNRIKSLVRADRIDQYFAVGTVRAFFEQVYRQQRLLGCARFTCVEYRSSVNLLDRFAGRPVLVADLNDSLVASFLADLAVDRSPATVNKHSRQLLAIARLARRRKLTDYCPDLEPMKVNKPIPCAWTDEEIVRLVEAAGAWKGKIVPRVPAALFWPALILTLLRTGLRITALMRAKRSDLDITRSLLRIPAENQKQRADQAFILDAVTLKLLGRLTAAGYPQLFAWPYDRGAALKWKTLRQHFRAIVKQAGLPAGPKDMFHKLRRTCATKLANTLGEQAASTYLGHSCLSVTKAYLDTTQIQRLRLADAFTLPPVRLGNLSPSAAASPPSPPPIVETIAAACPRPSPRPSPARGEGVDAENRVSRFRDDPAFLAAVAEEVAKILLARGMN